MNQATFTPLCPIAREFLFVATLPSTVLNEQIKNEITGHFTRVFRASIPPLTKESGRGNFFYALLPLTMCRNVHTCV